MSDTRGLTVVLGGGAAILLAAALITATVFTGPSAATTTNVIAGSLALVLLTVGLLFAGLLARTCIRRVLNAISRRSDKQFAAMAAERRAENEALLALTDRTSSFLAEPFAKRDREFACLADELAQQSKATGSLARSLKLQTEAITQIRKQTRAILEDYEGSSAERGHNLTVATEGRDMSRKLLNLVRNGQRDLQGQIQPISPALREFSRKSDELEAGQRRVMNFLRKEGGIQILLDKLVAAERRLVASFEASALTSADTLSTATSQSVGAVREDVGGLRRAIEELRFRTELVGADVGRVVPQMLEMTADLGNLSAEFVAARTVSEVTGSTARESADQLQGRFDVVAKRIEGNIAELPNTARDVNADVSQIRDSVIELQGNLESVYNLTESTNTDVRALGPRIDRNGIEVVKQVEALFQLLERVDTSAMRYPSSGGWAMTPDSLLLLSDLVRDRRPRRIVELGSGSSTVWVGTFAKEVGATLYSIEHLEEYRQSTALALEGFGLDETVDLRLAELTDIEVNGETRKWYEPQVFQDLTDIDMLIVDGPPKSTGPEPRRPAFENLRDKLAPGALIVVDDLHRGLETEMVRAWMEQDANLSWTSWAAGRTGVLEYRGNTLD